jgi:hypothetical protein
LGRVASFAAGEAKAFVGVEARGEGGRSATMGVAKEAAAGMAVPSMPFGPRESEDACEACRSFEISVAPAEVMLGAVEAAAAAVGGSAEV